MLEFLTLTSVPNYRLQQGFFVIPSDLPGMDFTTLSMMSKHKVSVLRLRNIIMMVQIYVGAFFTTG